MPEDLNAEIAETLASAEGARAAAPKARSDEIVEIVEAVLLAVVAIATAWGGYQAARWDGRQAELYGRASTTRNEADQALTLGGQQRLLDVSTFNTWIEAQAEGRDDLAALYERRFSPEFRAAFDAWIALDPLSNPDAPPGPSFMPEYENPLLDQGAQLNDVRTDSSTRARARDITPTSTSERRWSWPRSCSCSCSRSDSGCGACGSRCSSLRSGSWSTA